MSIRMKSWKWMSIVLVAISLASLSSKTEAQKILMVGDSITAGELSGVVEAGASTAARLKSILPSSFTFVGPRQDSGFRYAAEKGRDMDNFLNTFTPYAWAGVGANKLDGWASETGWLGGDKPDLIVVMIGINDIISEMAFNESIVLNTGVIPHINSPAPAGPTELARIDKYEDRMETILDWLDYSFGSVPKFLCAIKPVRQAGPYNAPLTINGVTQTQIQAGRYFDAMNERATALNSRFGAFPSTRSNVYWVTFGGFGDGLLDNLGDVHVGYMGALFLATQIKNKIDLQF